MKTGTMKPSTDLWAQDKSYKRDAGLRAADARRALVQNSFDGSSHVTGGPVRWFKPAYVDSDDDISNERYARNGRNVTQILSHTSSLATIPEEQSRETLPLLTIAVSFDPFTTSVVPIDRKMAFLLRYCKFLYSLPSIPSQRLQFWKSSLSLSIHAIFYLKTSTRGRRRELKPVTSAPDFASRHGAAMDQVFSHSALSQK